MGRRRKCFLVSREREREREVNARANEVFTELFGTKSTIMVVLWKSIQWYYYTYPHTLRGQIHVKKDPQKLCLKTFGDYCTLD